MADYIPELMFTGYQLRGADDHKLSFMTPYSEDKAFEKRLDTVRRWCNQGVKPELVKNVPSGGFKIDNNVRRYRTDNVVWELTHPKGFNFQITSENLCELLLNSEILNGEIQQQLLFVRRGNENYLTSTSSDIYKNALTQKKYETKVSVKDLKIGDILTLKTGVKVVYYGKFHSVKFRKRLKSSYYNSTTEIDKEIKQNIDPNIKSKLYCFYKEVDGCNDVIKLSTGLTVLSIDGHDNNVTESYAIQKINESMINTQRNANNVNKIENLYLSYNGYGDIFLGVRKKPFKLSEIQSFEEDLSLNGSIIYNDFYTKVNGSIISGYQDSYNKKYNYYMLDKHTIGNVDIYFTSYTTSNSYYRTRVEPAKSSYSGNPIKPFEIIYTA